MPNNRHEFRTIEEFVQLIESDVIKSRNVIANTDDTVFMAFLVGRVDYCLNVLDIIRNSNIGIVYPPEDK